MVPQETNREGDQMKKVSADLKLKAYIIISKAIEDGIAMGFSRAHKHTNTPNSTDIHEAVLAAVMSELCDIIDFGD